MRYSKVILRAMVGMAALGIFAWAAWRGYRHYYAAYRRFAGQDAAYYAQVAHDCDAVLKRHPMGSAGLITLTNSPKWFGIPLADESVTATLSALHPRDILVSTNSVWLDLGGNGELDWSLTWQRLEDPPGALSCFIPDEPEKILWTAPSP